jgi:hypothetical protein
MRRAVVAVGAAALAATAVNSALRWDASRVQWRRSEVRRFSDGSTVWGLDAQLRTGDVLLFQRAAWDPPNTPLDPLRSALILLQRPLVGKHAVIDHVGVVVRRNGVAYVLERATGGCVSVRTSAAHP